MRIVQKKRNVDPHGGQVPHVMAASRGSLDDWGVGLVIGTPVAHCGKIEKSERRRDR